MAHLLPKGDKLTVIAVLGAGIVVGISGIYLYYKFHRCLNQEISNLTTTVDCLKRDIELLKQRGNVDSNVKKRKQRAKYVDTDAAGYYTANPSSGDEAEEYFDLSDDDWSSVNGSSETKIVSFGELDKLLNGDDDERRMAHQRLRNMKNELTGNASYLWRMARSCYDMAVIAGSGGDMANKKALIFEGEKLSKMALAIRDDDADVHKWYAITLGSCGDFLGVQEKIKNAFIFKEHVEKAIELSPEDPALYHLMGRWCYEVSMTSWMERKVAATIFAAPPTSSFAEARDNFLKAEKLKPDQWKENILYIAKSLVGLGEYAAALKWLDKASKIPDRIKDDEVAQKEVDTLKHKYRSYRTDVR